MESIKDDRLSIDEAADFLGISRSSFYRLRKKESIPSCESGVFSKKRLKKWWNNRFT